MGVADLVLVEGAGLLPEKQTFLDMGADGQRPGQRSEVQTGKHAKEFSFSEILKGLKRTYPRTTTSFKQNWGWLIIKGTAKVEVIWFDRSWSTKLPLMPSFRVC